MPTSLSLAPLLVTLDRWGPWHDGVQHGGPPWFWPVFPLLWVAVIVVVLLVRRGRSAGRRAGEARLAERFAAGEIGEDEYRGRLAVLRDKASGKPRSTP